VFAYAMALLSSAWLVWLGADTRGGAIDYWYRFSKLGIGLDDLRYPVWWQEFFGTQERVQRWVAYIILPVGLALLAFRSLQAFVSIFKGERQMIIASHEAEELVAENKDIIKD
jgi:C4-dicarboxylate transporter DctQ subunit